MSPFWCTRSGKSACVGPRAASYSLHLENYAFSIITTICLYAFMVIHEPLFSYILLYTQVFTLSSPYSHVFCSCFVSKKVKRTHVMLHQQHSKSLESCYLHYRCFLEDKTNSKTDEEDSHDKILSL